MVVLLKKLRRSRFALLGALGLALGAPGAALAFGFGALSVESYLGDPLHATIRLETIDQRELNSLGIDLVSREEYAEYGIEYPPLDDLSLRIVQSGAASYLRVSSASRFHQPYLNLLLRAEWEGGQAVRQYTLLMNLREVAKTEPATPAQLAAAPDPIPLARVPVTTGRPQVPEVINRIRVRPGDTLSAIVRRLQLSPSVSLDQGLMALFQANPEAFIGDNMNWLLAGSVLQVPSAEQIASVSPAAARQAVAAQYRSWREQTRQSAASGAGSGSGSGTRLTLSAAGFSNLQERADTLEADLLAANQTNRQLVERLTKLEAELARANELIARTERLLAQAEQAQAPASGQASGAAAPAPPANTAVQAPESSAPRETAPAPSAAPAPPAPQADPADSAAGIVSVAEDWLVVARQRLKAVMDRAGRHPLIKEWLAKARVYRTEGLIGLLSALLALVLYRGFRRRRLRKKSESDPLANATRQDPALTPDGDPATAAGDLNINRVDALTEAETYLSYDLPDQARKVLEAAWRDQPDRYDLAVKLLEIYRSQGAKRAFDSMLDRLRKVMPEADSRWDIVDQLIPQLKADTPPDPAGKPAEDKIKPAPAAPPAPGSDQAAKSPGAAESMPASDGVSAAQLLQLESYVREKNLPAFEKLADELLAKLTLPDGFDLVVRIGQLREKLTKPETPGIAGPAGMQADDIKVEPKPAPVKLEPKAAPGKVRLTAGPAVAQADGIKVEAKPVPAGAAPKIESGKTKRSAGMPGQGIAVAPKPAPASLKLKAAPVKMEAAAASAGVQTEGIKVEAKPVPASLKPKAAPSAPSAKTEPAAGPAGAQADGIKVEPKPAPVQIKPKAPASVEPAGGQPDGVQVETKPAPVKIEPKAPAKVEPAAGSAGVQAEGIKVEPKPAPAKAEPKPAPVQVQPKPAPAAPAKAEGAAAPASVGSAPAKAPAKPAAGAPGPAKPPVKPAGAPPVDISSFPVSASNALEMAKIYMNMEEMDIAKQFLTQAAENGSPEQKEEAKQLLEWWK